MSMTLGSQAPTGGLRVKGRSPLAWALRRAAIGVVILAVTIGGAAWLFNASIEPEADVTSDAQAVVRKATAVVATPAQAAGKSASAAQ